MELVKCRFCGYEIAEIEPPNSIDDICLWCSRCLEKISRIKLPPEYLLRRLLRIKSLEKQVKWLRNSVACEYLAECQAEEDREDMLDAFEEMEILDSLAEKEKDHVVDQGR